MIDIPEVSHTKKNDVIIENHIKDMFHVYVKYMFLCMINWREIHKHICLPEAQDPHGCHIFYVLWIWRQNEWNNKVSPIYYNIGMRFYKW